MESISGSRHPRVVVVVVVGCLVVHRVSSGLPSSDYYTNERDIAYLDTSTRFAHFTAACAFFVIARYLPTLLI